jgi:antitoxin HicB
MYSVNVTLDDNGTVLVTCPDLPEVTTFREDEEDAIRRAADAIEEALAARMFRREDIPHRLPESCGCLRLL